MDNIHLECHCNLLLSSASNFIASIDSCPISRDKKAFKKEQRYIRKVKKKLEGLIKLLNEAPNY